MFSRSFIFEGSLKRASMQLLFPLSVRKPVLWDIKGFHHANLVGDVSKIISKILANKLKTVLEKIISRFQNAFIMGRHILDSVLVANECLDSQIRPREPGAPCKLDLEVPNDSVNWEFLLYLLRRDVALWRNGELE
jgi:hypothetical protein